jgi:hypothetical protein
MQLVKIIAFGLYLFGAWFAFILIHGFDYNAQSSGLHAWMLTAKDVAFALLWPIVLAWFVIVGLWYWVCGFIRGGF